MDKMIENRSVVSDLTKPMLKDRTLSGYWLPFNTLSQPLIAERGGQKVIFREIIIPSALDSTDLTNTKCCLNHDETDLLGRVPNTLTISRDDRGMSFECILPNIEIGDEVVEYTNRGDYQGNSFRYVTMAGDDAWERQADGTFIRTVNRIRAVLHIGPVFDPAFTQTDLTVAMRSLENSGIMIEVEEDESDEDSEDASAIGVDFKSVRSRRIDILEKY